MPKISLNPSPIFKGKVSIPVPGEEPAEVELVFKHFTRKGFEELMKKSAPKDQGGTLDDLSLVMAVAQDWDLDVGFNAENVGKLLDGYHAAGRAIMERYAEMLLLGRLGN